LVSRVCLAFDTSNYTTSVAWFDGEHGENAGKLLDVPVGALGLRQSEALFSHLKRLPEVIGMLKLKSGLEISAVGAASKPREDENSYMPCFLAGLSQGSSIAEALELPFCSFSHQQGHVAAAAWSAGRLDLLDTEHLAWHISGGTTELLLVRPNGRGISCESIGGTTDLAAGQLIDRAGGLLGLNFPAGRELDELSRRSASKDFFAPRVNGLGFSLSGVENKVREYYLSTKSKEDTAYFALRSVISAIERATKNARERYGDLPVLFSGGVASNLLLRGMVDGVYPEPLYARDNAMGIAVLTHRQVFG
jgi:N6-L-threonylcarbamoyladenine synthase